MEVAMSVRWMRTAQIRDGKFMEAIAWSKEIVGYCEKKLGIPKIHTWLDSFGALGTMRWTIDFADLGAIEKVQQQLMTDPDYWRLLARGSAELFIPGQSHDHVSRAI
jgi:hypothetical protein